jgi:hypothetical protein
VPLALRALMAAHNADRQHPMGPHQPSDGHGVGRRGGEVGYGEGAVEGSSLVSGHQVEQQLIASLKALS